MVLILSDNNFFKPTVLYKEYMILDMIEKNSNITQREISKNIGIAVSTTNDYINEYEKKGLVKRKRHSTKNVEYFVTKKGVERKKVLNIGFLNSTLDLYNKALEGLVDSLIELELNGYKKILLYGAGEVAGMIVHALKITDRLTISLLAIIDDDELKIDKEISGVKIKGRNAINQYKYDCILISSYTDQRKIASILNELKIDQSKIIVFFN